MLPSSWSSALPLIQLLLHGSSNQRACFITRHATCQKFVVSRVRVSYVSSHSQIDGACLKLFGCSRTADAARVLLTGVFGNGLLLLGIGQAFLFRPSQRAFFDQHTLALVPFS